MQEKNKKSVLQILNIGERIRTVRTMLKLSQGDFASKIGANSYSTILRYEKNMMKPSMDKIGLIADLGHTTERWLLTGDIDIESCDRLIKYVKEKHLGYRTIGYDLNVPKDLLSAIESHKIQPSANFIKKICNFYDIDKYLFVDIFLQLENFGISSLTGFDKITNEDNIAFDKIAKINKMLLEDESAQDMIFDLLKARKVMENAKSELKSPIKKALNDT